MTTQDIKAAINSIDDDQMTPEFVESFKIMLNNHNFKDIHPDIKVKLELYESKQIKPEVNNSKFNLQINDYYMTVNGSVVVICYIKNCDEVTKLIYGTVVKGGCKKVSVDTWFCDEVIVGSTFLLNPDGKCVRETADEKFGLHLKNKCNLVFQDVSVETVCKK